MAEMADGGSWHGFWFADHYMVNTGSDELAPGDVHECWSVLAAAAALTHRVRIGSLVSPTSVHHPAVLANRAATIDHISGGRLVLGLGAGWQINEHKAYGIDLEPPGRRVSRFEEAIQVTRSLLDNDRTTFDGDFYHFANAPCDPKPIQDMVPILVGTNSPRMLRITARHAQEWNTWGTPTQALERRQRFEAACEAVGTDPDSMHSSVQALVFMNPDAVTAESIRLRGGPPFIAGSNDQLVEELGLYSDMGFDEVIVPDFNFGESLAERKEQLTKFSSEIAPQLA